VYKDTVTINSYQGGGPYSDVPREYKGGFDRVTVRTTDYTKNMWTTLDDLGVFGGFTPTPVALDILPGDDPNSFVPNKKSKGRIPMAILGSEDLDFADVDLDSISIGVTVFPVKEPKAEKDEDGDGLVDLVMHFSRRDLIDALHLDLEEPGAEVEVTVEADLVGGCCGKIVGTDVLVIAPLSD